MWKPMTSDEILAEKTKNPPPGLLKSWFSAFSIMCLLAGFARKTGWTKETTTVMPISWAELLNELPLILLVSLLGASFYIIGVYRKRKKLAKTEWLCLSCESALFHRGQPRDCSCGGHFHELSTLKWVK